MQDMTSIDLTFFNLYFVFRISLWVRVCPFRTAINICLDDICVQVVFRAVSSL